MPRGQDALDSQNRKGEASVELARLRRLHEAASR